MSDDPLRRSATLTVLDEEYGRAVVLAYVERYGRDPSNREVVHGDCDRENERLRAALEAIVHEDVTMFDGERLVHRATLRRARDIARAALAESVPAPEKEKA